MSPDAEYFFARGFALRVKLSYSISKFRIENTGSANFQFNYKSTSAGVRPFIRYYLYHLMIDNKTSFFGYVRGDYKFREAIVEFYGRVAGRQKKEYTYTTPSFLPGQVLLIF